MKKGTKQSAHRSDLSICVICAACMLVSVVDEVPLGSGFYLFMYV